MKIFIFGSRGPRQDFKFDSDVDVVVEDFGPEISNEFEVFKENFSSYSIEQSYERAALDLFYLKKNNSNIPMLESVYDFGDRTIEFTSLQNFLNFKTEWKEITENDLMKIVIDAKKNCKYN